MSEKLYIGDWARSTRSGEVGQIKRIKEIRGEQWAELAKQATKHLSIPFVERIECLEKSEKGIKGVYIPPKPRQNYRRPDERILTYRNRNVTVITKKYPKKKVSKISVSDLINEEVQKK